MGNNWKSREQKTSKRRENKLSSRSFRDKKMSHKEAEKQNRLKLRSAQKFKEAYLIDELDN